MGWDGGIGGYQSIQKLHECSKRDYYLIAISFHSWINLIREIDIVITQQCCGMVCATYENSLWPTYILL